MAALNIILMIFKIFIMTPYVLDAFDFGNDDAMVQLRDLNVHHRVKRYVGALPREVNFTMTPKTSLSTLKRGQKAPFQVDIQFPSGTTDINVEIFAPSTSLSAIMMLCDININVGSKLQINGSKPAGQNILNSAMTLGGIDSVTTWPNTWAKISLSRVTPDASVGSPLELNDISVSITFNAVMLNSKELNLNQTYYINTGAEYSNDSDIWVCQSPISANATDPSATFPANQFNMSGDPYLYPGQVSTFDLNLYLPSDVTSFSVELNAPSNDVTLVSTCQIGLKSTGRGYSCRPKTQWNTNYVNNKQYYFHESYYNTVNNFAEVVNSYTYDATSLDDHRITLQLYVLTNQTAQIGKSSYVGVAVKFNNSIKNWFYNYSVTVTNPPNVSSFANSSLNPTIVVKNIGSSSLSLNTASSFSVEIDIPENTISDYELQILMPSNNVTNQSYLQLCKAEIISVGKNLPCLDQTIKSIKPAYQSLYNDSGLLTYNDFVSIKFNRVLNSGIESTSINPNNNKIIVYFYVKMLNNTLNQISGTVSASIGLFYDNRHCVTLFDLTLNNNAPVYENGTVNFALVLPSNNANLYTNSIKEFNFIIQTNPGSTYSSMDFEIILPSNNSNALFSICKPVWIVSVGRNLACFDQNYFNSRLNMTSTLELGSNSMIPDKISGSLGIICNSGVKGGTATDDDKLVIGVQIKLLNIMSNVISTGSSVFITAGALFSDTQLWVGQLELIKTSDDNLVLPSQNYPKVNFLLMDTVTPNQIATFNVFIKLAPFTEAFYFFMVSSQSTTGQSGICYIKAVRAGKNIPCFDPTDVKMINSSYFSSGNTMLLQSRTVSLGLKSNTGNNTLLYDDTRFDDNTIVLEVAVKIGVDVSGSFQLNGKVYFKNGEVPVVLNTAVGNTLTNITTLDNNTLPTYNLIKVALLPKNMTYSSTVSSGEVFRAMLSITLAENSKQNIVVKFSTPVNESNIFDISNVNLFSVGANVFCLFANYPVGVYSRRTGSATQDAATLNLGTVCQQNLNPINPENNQIQVEVIGRFWSYSTKNSGDAFQLAAIINVNSDRITVVQLMMNVSNATVPYLENYPNMNFTANLSLNSAVVRIGDIVNATLVLTVPPEIIGQCYIDFRSPNQTLASSEMFDLIDMKIINSGRNLGFIHNEPFPVNFISSRNNTQNDKGSITPMVCFNTGLTYRTKQYKSGDDELTISYVFRVTDNQNTSNGSTATVSVGFQYGSYIIIANSDVTIFRDGSEKPVFNCNTSILNNVTTFTINDVISVSTQCRLANSSTAEPQKVFFRYYLPPYLTYLDNSFNTLTYYIGNLSFSSLATCFQVQMLPGAFLFDDNVNFQFKIKVLQSNKIRSTVILPWEVAYSINNIPGNALTGLQLKEANYLSFTLLGSQDQSSTCLNKFGMDDANIIKDCAIKAFMAPFGGNEATQVRPSLAGWIPHVRDQDFNSLRYITVLFGTMKDVNKIEVYAIVDQSRALMIDIHRTYDGRVFVLAVSSLFLNYNETTNTASALIPGQLRARGVRIVIKQTTNDSAKTPFRFELFGCASSNVSVLSQDFDPCSRRGFDEPTEEEVPKEYYPRGYLYHSDLKTLYYCDTVVTDKDSLRYEPRCFRTKDSGQFEVLGRDVSSIVGISTNDNTLFGVSADRRGYVTSVDYGFTWSLINPGAWEAAKATLGTNNLVTAVGIPWIVNSSFNAIQTGLNCQIAQNDWRFCYDGIYVNNQQMVKWNTCCSL